MFLIQNYHNEWKLHPYKNLPSSPYLLLMGSSDWNVPPAQEVWVNREQASHHSIFGHTYCIFRQLPILLYLNSTLKEKIMQIYFYSPRDGNEYVILIIRKQTRTCFPLQDKYDFLGINSVNRGILKMENTLIRFIKLSISQPFSRNLTIHFHSLFKRCILYQLMLVWWNMQLLWMRKVNTSWWCNAANHLQ